MENLTDFIIPKKTSTRTNSGLSVRSADFNLASEAVANLITEGGENFYKYVDGIGLAKESNLIVLSSKHNYYYDCEEMNNAKTVIILKELNRIKQVKSILHSHLHYLPQRCNFVGCFVNNRKIERYALRNCSCFTEETKNSDELELGIVSKFPFINMMYSIMDLKTNTYMSERSVTLMLRVHGFKVMDMTESNGLTFFHSQKVEETFN